jgi:hypothetical protein
MRRPPDGRHQIANQVRLLDKGIGPRLERRLAVRVILRQGQGDDSYIGHRFMQPANDGQGIQLGRLQVNEDHTGTQVGYLCQRVLARTQDSQDLQPWLPLQKALDSSGKILPPVHQQNAGR